jgi:hypothetical protein
MKIDERRIDKFVPESNPSLRGVEEKLRAGAKVADVGCGYGSQPVQPG